MLKIFSNQILFAVMAIGIISLLIWLAGSDPIAVTASLFYGAFGNINRFARVVANLAPLLLCASGLIFTFTAGLYNLGVEGQIAFGAIATTFVLRLFYPIFPAPVVICLGLIAGCLGGCFWGLLAGTLNVYGRVNEIFAGLGLNFVADGIALYLILNSWKRAGVASMSGTELFDQSLWLGTFGQTDASPVALAIAFIALGITFIVIKGSYFGLQLQAVGKNLRAAYVLGIPAVSQLLSAFAICGAFAGIAGALQVLAVFHRLIPGISSNLGFLALLVAMIAGFRPIWILPVAFCFSALNIGSLQLPLSLQLESSLAGVIQGILVLLVLLGRGFKQNIALSAGHGQDR